MSVRNAIALLLAVAVVSGRPGPARAWDGERQGFVVALGWGLGATYFTRSLEDWGRFAGGLSGDFKIGYARSRTLQLFYFQKLAILEPWRMGDIVQDTWDDWSVLAIFAAPFQLLGLTDLLTGVGVTQYAKPEAPSWLYGGGVGAYIPFPHAFGDSEDEQAEPGLGLYAEVGYEWTRHRHVAAHLMWGRPRDLDAGVCSLMVTFDLIGY
jgi:hypothetical protein